MPDQRPQWRCP